MSGIYSGYPVNISVMSTSGFEFGCVFVYTQFNIQINKSSAGYLLANRRNPDDAVSPRTRDKLLPSLYDIVSQEGCFLEDLFSNSYVPNRITDAGVSQLLIDGKNLHIRFPGVVKEKHRLLKNLQLAIDIATAIDHA